MAGLTRDEARQLRVLKAVADNPAITGYWNGTLGARLMDLGYAKQSECNGIWIVSITDEGRRAADALEGDYALDGGTSES